MSQAQKDTRPRRGLIDARNSKHWSQQELADQLAITPVTVSRWETGVNRPSQYFRMRLCQLFNRTPEALDLVDTSLPGSLQAKPAWQQAVPAIVDPAIPLPQPWRLCGRDQTLAEIKRRLRSGDSFALSALDGLPGMGKTALAVWLAHDPEVREMFPDGVLWAGLGPDPNLMRVLSRWGTLLGIPEAQMARLTDLEAWELALRMAIGQRTILLLIDDAWTLEEALQCRIGGPRCSYLLTTRSRAVATSFAGSQVTQVGELGEQEGLALLEDLAGAMGSSEQAALQDLVQKVGGLPLALVLIGRYLHLAAGSGQPRRLQAALTRMQRTPERLRLSEPQAPLGPYSSLPPHTPLSLQAVIAASVGRLPESVQAAFYALSVFPAKPHSFSEAAALHVAACAVEALDALYDAGLLESTGPDRYSMHQTIADFGCYQQEETQRTEEVSQSASRKRAEERCVTYYAGYVVRHRSDYDALAQEIAPISAALEMAYAHNMETLLVQMILGIADFLEVRSMYALAEEQLQRAEQVVRAGDDRTALPDLLLHRGSVAQKQGEYAKADCLYHEGIEIARGRGQTEVLCALLAKRGWVAEKRGMYPEAERLLQEGLSLARLYNYEHVLPDLLNTLGTVADETGNSRQAIAFYQEGLSLARQRGDPQQTCVLLLNLAVTEVWRGNFAQAKALDEEALVLARQLQHHEWQCLLLNNLGNLVKEAEDLDQAEPYLIEGLGIARRIGNREWLSQLLVSLGEIAIQRGEYAQAEMYLRESLELAQQIEKPWLILETLASWGELLLKLGRIGEAEAIFHRMLAIMPEGDTYHLGLAQYGTAQVAAERGDAAQARRLGGISLATLAASERPDVLVRVKEWLGALPAGGN